jgi:hypothetical protein
MVSPVPRGGPPRSPQIFRGEGPQLYRAAFARNRPFAKPGPYTTTLHPAQEAAFRGWLAANPKILFDPAAKRSDYDMRGYWKATGGAIPTVHERGSYGWPDTYKTPYDTTFSNQSIYATPSNPFTWRGNNLIDGRTGQVLFSPKGG